MTTLITANLIALGALILFVLRGPSLSDTSHSISPLDTLQLSKCRQSISQALLRRGQTGIVQTQESGKILIQIHSPTEANGPPRRQADAGVWAALEAVANASRGDCVGFEALQVNVLLQSSGGSLLHATARVSFPNLLLWSLGEIDDAEFSQRVDYQPPASATPTPP